MKYEQVVYRSAFSCTLRFLFISYIILSITEHIFAQFYSRGEDPSNLRWNQICSDHFRVIYPQEFNDKATWMTHILEFYYEQNSSCLNHHPGKIPVILHNHSVFSGGFVAWAPKRMELVTNPSPDSYPQDHFEQLALHEFRHVVQVDKLDQGMTRIFRYILGEQGVGAITGLMPLWYLEGDAVDAETSLSRTGRGRLPSFEKELRAILLERGKLYPYEKAYFGSFRDHVPTRYEYGYQMVVHGNNNYGLDIWGKMIDFTAKNPYSLYPFYFGLKKNTGLSKTGFYRETLNSLKDYWTEQDAKQSISTFNRINNRPSENYTSYRFPSYYNDSVIFAEKSGIDQIEEFILIDRKGNEKIIHIPGFYYPANISLSGNLVVWAELISDERWGRESYSHIKSFDLNTGKEKLLTHKSYYYAPELSPDGQQIVVTETNPTNDYALTILNANTGEVMKKIPSAGNEYLQYPVWSQDGKKILVSSLGNDGKRIKEFNLTDNIWTTLLYSGFDDIGELSAGGKYLLFRGTFSGKDNIYALDMDSGDCFRITYSRFGAYYPHLSANGKKLLYSDYTSRGFDIVETSFEKSAWIRLDSILRKKEPVDSLCKKDENRVPDPGSVPLASYPVKPYSKLSNLFNIHSWAPFYYDYDNPDIENPQVYPGITLLSQNLLSTAFTTIGYEYRNNDHFVHASFIYKGFYPVFRFRYDFGGFPFIADPPDDSLRLEKVKTNLTWRLKVYLPLDMTSNRFVRGFQPSVECYYKRSYLYYSDPGKYRTGETYFDYRLYAYSYLKTSERDILPSWGQVVDLRYVHAPFNREQIGSQVTTQGILYIPGFLRHNTLKISVIFLKQKAEKYIMNNLISMPRGYDSFISEKYTGFTADYIFPVLYPDFTIWHFLYVKRIKSAIFYDHGSGKNVYIDSGNGNMKEGRIFRSLGFELTSDFHLIQILFPFDAGIRYSYLPDEKKSKTELVFSIDINRF